MANETHTARIFCIGQNYVAHIRELSNPMPLKPVIFMRPLSCLVAPGEQIHFPQHGELRQDGNTNDMLFGFERLIAELSSIWTLQPGDMIYTGTPGGVGALQIGDVIEVENDQIGTCSWTIIV